MMSLATKIIPDKEANTVTLENWGNYRFSSSWSGARGSLSRSGRIQPMIG